MAEKIRDNTLAALGGLSMIAGVILMLALAFCATARGIETLNGSVWKECVEGNELRLNKHRERIEALEIALRAHVSIGHIER